MRLYIVSMRVLMPVLSAARMALCSVCCSVRQEVGLMIMRMGFAYVNLVRMSVLYSNVAMYVGMFLFRVSSCLIVLIV